MIRTLLLSVSLISSIYLSAQSFRFNTYTSEDGLAQDFIYSINQDKNGYLWVGTGEGLSRFDGKNFITFTESDNLSDNVITCSYFSEDGDLFLGHNNGSLSRFSDDKFTPYSLSGISSIVNDIDGAGNDIFYVTQNGGVFVIDQKSNEIRSIGTFDGEAFYSISAFDRDNLIVGTNSGLFHLVREGNSWKKQATLLENEWISAIAKTKEEGIFLVGTKGGQLLKTRLYKGKIEFSRWDGQVDISRFSIRTVMLDNQDNIWLGTNGQGVVKLHTDTTGEFRNEMTIYSKESGLPSNVIESIFQDREGNIWIGTFGQGLAYLIDDFFTFYSHDPVIYGTSVSSIWIDEENKWYGVDNGLIRISPQLDAGWMFYSMKEGLPKDEVTALVKWNDFMFIGTSANGAFMLDLSTNKIQAIRFNYSSLENRINSLVVRDQDLWLATDGGLIIYNLVTKEHVRYNTESGLPHNSIQVLLLGTDNRVWMGTHSRFLYSMTPDEMEQLEIATVGEVEVSDIAEDRNGDVWIATTEKGIYHFKDKKFYSYSTRNGLKSDYCYAIEEDSKGHIWVGHRGALSKVDPVTDRIESYDHNSGIVDQINKRAMFTDDKGYLWIGTSGGGIKYDPTKDIPNDIPPVINLLKIIVNETEYSPDDVIELPYGNYRVEFKFVGVSFSNPEKVYYQYQLIGYDGRISDPSYEPQVTYGKISTGDYTFKVSACNEWGACSEYSARINLTIAKPFWQTWWFYSLVFIAIVIGVWMFVRIRTKRLIAQQIYLEEQLEIKTKEVVEKAEEIAEINKDITASINYAERIQKAILPKISVLQDALPESFIFFRPRDIVSGDFYYVEHIGNKLVVACADCTGHGVPGAFMSMIGSVALRNIYEKMELTNQWKTPEEVLEELDREVELVLQQQEIHEMAPEDSFFHSRDGMDITVCHINLETREVAMSAAMRTSLIYHDNEVKLIPGDKRPIGGGDTRGVSFTVSRYQMKKGDALYLFSDGYTDQFGGEDGRKLKLGSTKKMIESLHAYETLNRYEVVEKTFDDWKGNWEQIDDVLFMALLF